MTRPRTAEQQTWMPMSKNLMIEATGFTGAEREEGDLLDQTKDALMRINNTISKTFSDIEVNHRPAAQEWAVCTP